MFPHLEWDSDPEEIDNDPGEVHIANHHHIEVSEQLQFLQADSSLTISVLGILEILKYSTTTSPT